MTALLWGRVLIAVVCSGTAAWVWTLMRRRRREGHARPEDQTRRMFWILTACAVTLTLSVDPLGRRLGELVGQPFLPDHLKHLIALGAFYNAVVAAENLSGASARHRPPTATRRIRQAWPFAAAAMFACYSLSPNRYDLLEVENGLGGWTGTLYWLLFMGYFLVVCIPFTVYCLRFGRTARDPSPRRSGVVFLGIGGLTCAYFGITKVIAVSIESGEGLRDVAMASGRAALIVAFLSICYGCWRSRGRSWAGFDRWASKVADLTRARWLRPMGAALHQATPDAGVDLTVVSPALRLATRETAVRDSITELTPWMDPADFEAIRLTLARQRDDEALVLATAVELARRRKLDDLRPVPRVTEDLHDDDGPMLQRLAAAWPTALDLADAVEVEHPRPCPRAAEAGAASGEPSGRVGSTVQLPGDRVDR